jgi:putative membrane protein insertion efficiency factor
MTAVRHGARAHPTTGAVIAAMSEAIPAAISGGLLLFYKRAISPLLHAAIGSTGACRFQPSCSEYAAIAVHAHGPVRGLALALWRVLRCHPLSRGGFDPVPGTWPLSGTWPTSKVPAGLAQDAGVGSLEGHNQAEGRNQAVHLP